MLWIVWLTLAGLIFALVGGVGPVAADAPDYALPARWALPWPCNESHRVTWDPAGHWTHYKATGIAFDFSMREGTPLFAPADGVAYFLRDERDLDTNLGNYVEIVIEDEWLVRLAHLRDRQAGERPVRAGELIGYSGGSGVSQEHLHLELLVRNGNRWVRPDLDRLETFFRLPISAFVENNSILNDGCPAELLLDGDIYVERETLPLGDDLTITVPVHNAGLEPLWLDKVQVTLAAPGGATQVVEADAGWSLPGKATETIYLTASPYMAGDWAVQGVWCQTDGATLDFYGEAAFYVQPGPLALGALVAPEALAVGERLDLVVEVENRDSVPVSVDNLHVGGTRPDGNPWVSTGEGGTIPPGETRQFTLQDAVLPAKVGTWQIDAVGYEQEGKLLLLERPAQQVEVVGPELVAEQLAVYPSQSGWSVFLAVKNVGTDLVIPDAIEIWGWNPDGEGYFTVRQKRKMPLAPGVCAFMRLDVPWLQQDRPGELVEIGYWVGSQYYRIDTLKQSPNSALPDLAE
ncbi:MAG: M23 family metallopeptidase [Chloroflexi bacterium]|nr:M23 family metallopeptidase [Chloroflexota bacterium]